MKLDMMKYLKNFRILFLIFFISKTVFANEINNIYFINSSTNNLTEINQYSFKNFLDNKNLNLINYSKNSNSIFDQADIYEEIAQLHTNKIIIFVDKYYLESILFESDYFLLSCSRDEIMCKENKRISYNEMFHPLINILHKRLLNLYFNHDNEHLLLIFNNFSKDTSLSNYFANHFFVSTKNTNCVVESLTQLESCINKFINN